ncbi:hypothetical protein AWENTII_001893 [Aspergillus wentii]
MMSAAGKHIDLELGVGRYPDPVHIFVQFLSMVPPGPLSIICNCLRTSSKQYIVKVELSRAQSTSTAPAPEASDAFTTIAIVTYTDLSREKGLSQDTTPAIAAPFPNRETDCAAIDDPVVEATPVTRKMNWIAPRTTNGFWGHRLGGHHREVWVSFRDGSKFSDILHLAFLADMPLQPAATHQAGFYTKYALSTLCMSVEIKKRPDPNMQWVMIRSHSNKVSKGRYDVSVHIFDESDDILALSNHVVFTPQLRPRASKM